MNRRDLYVPLNRHHHYPSWIDDGDCGDTAPFDFWVEDEKRVDHLENDVCFVVRRPPISIPTPTADACCHTVVVELAWMAHRWRSTVSMLRTPCYEAKMTQEPRAAQNDLPKHNVT